MLEHNSTSEAAEAKCPSDEHGLRLTDGPYGLRHSPSLWLSAPDPERTGTSTIGLDSWAQINLPPKIVAVAKFESGKALGLTARQEPVDGWAYPNLPRPPPYIAMNEASATLPGTFPNNLNPML